MNKQVRILSGLHSGAQTVFAEDERYLIGSDPSCSIVLCDAGIAARHCVIAVDAFGVTCRTVDAPVSVDDRPVAIGEVVSLEDFQTVQCGPVTLGVGPVDGEWPDMERNMRMRPVSPLDAVRSLKRLNPFALFAAVLIGMTGVLSLAYAALSDSKVELTPTRVEAARRWLKSVAPDGSELQIGVEHQQDQGLLLSGYVPFNHQVAALTAASRASEFKPRVDVYAADEMVSSLARLAQLAAIPCEPQYKGGGQVACTNAVTGEVSATKLRMIARDVPGLRALDVQVTAPPAAPPPQKPAVADTSAVQITQKFSVLIFSRGRYLVGPYGKRYTEGDTFDGFKINRIGVDQVIFERDGREYEFYVAALGASR